MDSTQPRCPRCNAVQQGTAVFCRACGAQLEVSPDPLRTPAQIPVYQPPPPPAPGTLPPPPPPGHQPYFYPPSAPVEGDTTRGWIPYKNPNALAAYYCAVFALIPGLGLFLAPVALYLGLAGLRYFRQYPVVKGAVHAWIGIIGGAGCLLIYLVYICILVVGALSVGLNP